MNGSTRKQAAASPSSEGSRWKNEHGQSLVEFAMSLPLYGLLVLGLGLFAWWAWNNLVVASAIGEGVRGAAVEVGTLHDGEQEVRQALRASLGGFAEEYHGSYLIEARPQMRSIRGGVMFELKWSLLPVRLEVLAGSLQRREGFYGGPPTSWE